MRATIVSAYAPKITNRPTDGDKFYKDLDGVISTTPGVCVCVCVCVCDAEPHEKTNYLHGRN